MSIPTGALPPDVLDALRHNDTIEAIKRLRESRGIGLKEAKDIIDGHLRGDSVVVTPATSPRHLPPNVVETLNLGNKIQAIRLLREHSGLGLKDAKDAVETYQRETSTIKSKLSPGEAPRSSSVTSWLVALAVAVIAAYFLYLR